MKAHPIQRRLHNLFIPGLESHLLVGHIPDKGFWVFSMHCRIQKEHVVHGMVACRSGYIRLAVCFRVGRSHAVGTAHGRLRRGGLQRAQSLRLSQADGVGCPQKELVVRSSGRERAHTVAQVRKGPGHVEGCPHRDAITEVLAQNARILRVVMGKIAVGPASLVLKRLRQVPMVHRAERSYAGF